MKTPVPQKELSKLLRIAHEAAEISGPFLKRKFGRFLSLSQKPDSTLVTEADQQSEKMIIRHIKKAFPHHSFLGEESGSSVTKHSYRWIIDPLDGTTNFVHRLPIFCISIGLEIDGILSVGLIHQPLTGDFYRATKGGGAFWNRKEIHVSPTKELSKAMLTTGFSSRKSIFLRRELDTFEKVVQKARAVRRLGSAALDLCYVATGQFDGFFEQNLAPWDVAAGLVILDEAGGRFTHFTGKSYRVGDESLLATNSLIHQSLINTLND